LPPTLAAIHFGSPYFDGLVLLAGAVLVWEWNRLCGRSAVEVPSVVAQAGVLIAILATILHRLDIASGALAAGAIAAGLLGVFSAKTAGGGPRRIGGVRWVAFGVLYVGIPAMMLVWVRDTVGRETIYWLFALVWATDTGAYLFGRLIGGPKLIPAISPNKTWAGLIGGMICSAAVGAAFAFAVGRDSFLQLALLSSGLAVAAQAGDFFESWVKRRFGVKDSGGIMPGHGGLLDRLDGLLAVVVVVALIAGLGRENGLVWL